MVNSNHDRTATRADGDLDPGLWLRADLGPVDDSPLTPPSAGLVTLGYLGAAIRRRVRMWLPLAILGFLIGAGLYVRFPPAYQATTTVLLAYGPNQNPQQQIYTDAALATSSSIATAALRDLGLSQSPAGFLASYSVTEPTDQVLVITASARTSAEAVRRASTIASEFLKLRARYALTAQSQYEAALAEQLTLASQHLAQATGQAAQLQAANTLAQLRQSVNGLLLTTRAATQSEIDQTQVIDTAAPVHHSRVKAIALYVGGGLVGGLAVGLGRVAIGALVSGRLRRRDDVAYAIGAPVRLSTGPLRGRTRAAHRDRELERLAEHLQGELTPAPKDGAAALAVVAVEDPKAVAVAVIAVARDIAGRGSGVLIADLSQGRHLAQRLGVRESGLHQVRAAGVELVLVVPDPGKAAPEGPLRARQPSELTEVAATSEVVLSLVTLDPALGGAHLSSWADSAVAVVTTGKSSPDAIRAAGEMIRMSGVRLASVVLVGADRDDESLGAWDVHQR